MYFWLFWGQMIKQRRQPYQINNPCATARPHRPQSHQLQLSCSSVFSIKNVRVVMFSGGFSPVLGLDSPGAGPVELERGGTLVLVLLLGFFSMFVSVQWAKLRSSSERGRAAELSTIKLKNWRGKRAAVSAGKATKALVHFCQTRRPHHGDILTTNKPEKNKRHDFGVSSYGGC